MKTLKLQVKINLRHFASSEEKLCRVQRFFHSEAILLTSKKFKNKRFLPFFKTKKTKSYDKIIILERIKLKIRIKSLYSVIEGLSLDIRYDLYDYLSFDVPGAKYSPKYKDNIENPSEREHGWDGKIHLYQKKNDSFLTGLIYKVYKYIKTKYNIEPEIIWDIKIPEKKLNLEWNEEYIIRPYQKEVIEKCLNKKRAVIEACTGSGKTIIISKIIQEAGVFPFIFYTLTKDLMYQAQYILKKTIKNIDRGINGWN